MKIINSKNKEIKTLEDYKLLAPPKEDIQWSVDHSALEFAKKVVNHSLEKELQEIMLLLEIQTAIAEEKMHTAFKKGHWSVEKGTSGGQKRTILKLTDIVKETGFLA